MGCPVLDGTREVFLDMSVVGKSGVTPNTLANGN